jgi:sulfatase maturation enzyme AslB (radical SAM superfamily)
MIRDLISSMKTSDILSGWKTILAGRPPFLSIEITKECPLSCPGCYAYGEDHIGGILLNQVSDFKGQELVQRFMELIDRYRPLHVSIVGGEPLVRFRELHEILPQLASRGIHTQLVTSAVRPIPAEWASIDRLIIVVSIDGLAPEHDVRRKPATYERILKNIEGHMITVHCTVTRQMTEQPGYLRKFMEFWCSREGTEKVWFSMFTPQVGETSYEILPKTAREQVIRELHELRTAFPKLSMTRGTINGFISPPSNPDQCIFARSTRTITADLKTRVGPCQFGGNPDCSQCGCIASAGLNSIGKYKLPGGIPIDWIYDASFKVGNVVGAMRGD